MTEKLKRLFGRVDLRLLLGLLAGACLLTWAAVQADLFKTEPVIEIQHNYLTSYGDLVADFLIMRDTMYPLVGPSMYTMGDTRESYISKNGLSFEKEPSWYWTFSSKTYVLKRGDPLTKIFEHNDRVNVYESMEENTILIEHAETGDVLLKYPALVWASQSEAQSKEDFWFKERRREGGVTSQQSTLDRER